MLAEMAIQVLPVEVRRDVIIGRDCLWQLIHALPLQPLHRVDNASRTGTDPQHANRKGSLVDHGDCQHLNIGRILLVVVDWVWAGRNLHHNPR